MAKRRMFSVDITDTDKFTDMKHSTQNLYFHLVLHADDDGFVASPKRTMKAIGASRRDLDTLIQNRYIIPINDRLIVITHWKAQNRIQDSKRVPTIHQEYYRRLEETSGGVYIYHSDEVSEKCRKMSDQIVSKDCESGLVSQSDAIIEEFEAVWSFYPRKEAKKDALEYYAKARKNGTSKQAILDGVKEYAEYVKHEKRESRFIMYFSTFLKKESWNDEYRVTHPVGVVDDSELLKEVFR